MGLCADMREAGTHAGVTADRLSKPGAGIPSAMQIVRILLAIILPPLGVLLTVGLKLHFWLNILLTILGFVPGIIHALYVILTFGQKT